MALESRNRLLATILIASAPALMCGVALAGPKGISISPSMGSMSSIRPDLSMRSLRGSDRTHLRGVATTPESSAKKKKKTAKPTETTKTKTIGKANIATKKIPTPVASTPPATPASLGTSPAGRRIEELQGKIDVPALDAVQGAAALPGALGTPNDGRGLPNSPRDPASAGPAMTLPSFGGQAGQDAAQTAARTREWMRGRIATEFVPGGRGDRGYVYSERGGQTGTPGTVGREPTQWVWTWRTGERSTVELTENLRGEGGFTVTEVRNGQTVQIRDYNRAGELSTIWVRNPDGTTTRTDYTVEGIIMSSVTRDAQGRVVTAYYNPLFYDSANPTSAGSRKQDGSAGGVASANPSGNTNTGNTNRNSSGNRNDNSGGGSGNTNTNSNAGSGNSNSNAGSGNTIDSSGNTNANDNAGNSASDEPTNEIGPSKDSSQPAEGTASNRNIFHERGVTHPGERPKQTARGSDDRNIPSESPVIIRRDGPPTPEELKAAVTQPGLGDARPTGGGGIGRNASDFAQPPPGSDPAGNATNPQLSGSGVAGAGGGLVNPNPGDPAEAGKR